MANTKVLTDLRSMIRFASDRAETIFRKTGEITGMYHAITKSGEHMVLTQPPGSKDASVAIVKLWMQINDVDRYVYINEAWILEVRSPQPIPDANKLASEGVHDHPDRREVVMFSAENRAGGLLLGMRYILRPEMGRPKLSPLKIEDMTSGTNVGRMVGLLT